MGRPDVRCGPARSGLATSRSRRTAPRLGAEKQRHRHGRWQARPRISQAMDDDRGIETADHAADICLTFNVPPAFSSCGR